MSNKPGMINVDPNQPLVSSAGIQLRLACLMCHPDYNLDKAFNGKGKIVPNRNEELDAMPLVDLLIDCRRRIEEEIVKGTRWAFDYGYSGFMFDCWKRALLQGLVQDDNYVPTRYCINGKLIKGKDAL
jgi:hypothetical protein